MPRALSAITDGRNALHRISLVFEADVLGDEIVIDENLSDALIVEAATFKWEAAGPEITEKGKGKGRGRTAPKNEAVAEKPAAPAQESFALNNLSFSIPWGGSIYAIVGPIGSGKSSLLNG